MKAALQSRTPAKSRTAPNQPLVPLTPAPAPVYRPGAWDFRQYPSVIGPRKEKP